ncbi:MAG: Fic family protein [Thermoleophilia bacterium]
MTIKEKALAWWGEQIKNDNYVVSEKEMDRRQREYLRKNGYLFPVARGFSVVKRREDDGDEVFPLLYWQTVERILSPYNWCLRSTTALQILNGDQTPQKQLLVRTKEKTNKKILLPVSFSISLQFDAGFDERLIKKMDVSGRRILVDVPERVLVDVSRLKSKDILSFVAGTKFDTRLLDAIYAKKPKPVVFKRLIELALKSNRSDLAVKLQKTIEYHTNYQVLTKTLRGNSMEPTGPAVISPPWVIRQKEQAKEFEATLTRHLQPNIAQIKKQPLALLLEQARKHKKYDTYHSTSLEGYKITPEEVDALLSGKPPEGIKEEGTEYLEKLKNQMAIIGYSEAFDFILKKVGSDFRKSHITEELIKDTYYNLFKPSVDAGIVDYYDLTSYRNMPVYIRGTRYAPPSYEKLPELMASYEKLVNEIKNPVTRAILAHYFFVTIHPYLDGNGRTGRLLMNYCLLSSGYSWVTIRTEQRVKYFDALTKAQMDDDILPFGKFIVEMLKEASKPSN